MPEKRWAGDNRHVQLSQQSQQGGFFLVGELDEAESLMREGLQAIRITHGKEHLRAIHSQYMLSQILMDEGKLDEAETLGRETLALFRKVAPAGDEYIGRSLLIFGRTLLAKGKAVEAAGMLRESADLFRGHDKTYSELIATADCWHGASLAQLSASSVKQSPYW